MATLKICTHSRTHWLTNVREVELLRSFSFAYPKLLGREGGVKSMRVEVDNALWAAAFPVGAYVPPCGVRTVDFDGQPHDVGHVLLVKRNDGGECVWVVPAQACFLMADDGGNIDRI